MIIFVHASTSTSALKIWYQQQFRCSFILLGKSAHPFVNNVYKAAQLARDMLAHVYILLIFPLCISTKNLYEKYNIIDTDALPPLQKYSRGNLKIYFADTENCISYLHIRGKRYFFCSISDEEYLLLAIKIVRSCKSTLRYSSVEWDEKMSI